jgi:crossover junction endodeoxyribonuclease RuvC
LAEVRKKAEGPYHLLGVDPGTTVMGFAVLMVHPRSLRVAEIGVLRLAKFPEHSRRLQKIYERLSQLIQTHRPRAMAIEAPFFGKNPQSMLKLGRAQGVAIAAAAQFDLDVTEYAPRRIKQAITGNGNASKEQVAAMIATELQLDTSRYLHDATDALATVLCHHYESQNPLAGAGKKGGWDAFLRNNPDRIR